MQTTKEWLKEKVRAYEQNPKETLEDMLVATKDAMLQFLNNPTSKAAKGVFESCIEHNTLFLNKISEN